MVLGVLGLVDLRWSANSCKLSTRCRLAMDFFTGVAELAEWWWFENSRACLYYFFIVNDCQFIVRSFASGREALKDGEVFVRCAFPYKAIVNFLVFESHLFDVFPRGFFVEGSILAQDERWRRA